MRVLVVLALAWCCSGQLVFHPFSANPYPWAFKYHTTDAFGQTIFGHQGSDQSRHEVRLADGRVIGQFSYIDPNGEPAITYFEAGPQGYRVLGSNILPEAPTADLAPPVNNLVAPVPVQYTAEVAHARAVFKKLYDEAAAAAAAAPEEPKFKTPAAAEKTAEEKPVADEIYESEEPPAGTFAAGDVAVDEPVETPAAAEEDTAHEKEISRKKRQVVVIIIKTDEERNRRDVSRVLLPYLHAVPTETEAKLTTQQFETVDAATPADTTKFELTTKEHVFKVPGFKYVQPVVEVKPVKYTALTPQIFPYQAAFPFYPLGFPGFAYRPTILAPSSNEEE